MFSSFVAVLQRKGTKTLPQFSADIKTLSKYLLNRTWALGLLCDISGSFFMVSALASAPVSVIQPVSGGGLVFLSLLSHFFFNEKLKFGEWVAVGLCFVGIVGVGVATTGITQQDQQTSVARLVLTLASFFGILMLGLRKMRQLQSRMGKSKPKAFAPTCGFFAGCFFSLSATTTRSGFVVGELTGRRLFFGLAGVGCSICNTSVGFMYQTLGLREGNAVMISTITTVTTIMIGMVSGRRTSLPLATATRRKSLLLPSSDSLVSRAPMPPVLGNFCSWRNASVQPANLPAPRYELCCHHDGEPGAWQRRVGPGRGPQPRGEGPEIQEDFGGVAGESEDDTVPVCELCGKAAGLQPQHRQQERELGAPGRPRCNTIVNIIIAILSCL